MRIDRGGPAMTRRRGWSRRPRPRSRWRRRPGARRAGGSAVSTALRVAPDAEQAHEFHPYNAPETRLPEFTARGVILGTILGMIFGASSLYLVLKVGLTVSASIPVAVISITLFRLASKLGIRDASILENNIVQTAGSAGESIAF